MTAFYATDGALGVSFSERTAGSATAFAGGKFTAGQIVDGSNGSKWMYVQASAAIGANDYVCIDQNFQASAGTQANVVAGQSIGFAAGTAFSQYDMGFVCVQSRSSGVAVNAASAASAGTRVYTSTIAGRVQTATSAAGGTAMTGIGGMGLVSSASSDSVTAVGALITYPCAA